MSFTLRSVRDRAAEILEYVAIVFVALMGYYLIRHAFNGPDEAFAADARACDLPPYCGPHAPPKTYAGIAGFLLA